MCAESAIQLSMYDFVMKQIQACHACMQLHNQQRHSDEGVVLVTAC